MGINYLYGAAVQGIQGFIFQTNELKDIVGASELVEQICTTKFLDFLGDRYIDSQAIVMAAGSIKYIFSDRETCKDLVLNFPKSVMEMAPGITVSQAVVEMTGDFSEFKDAVLELEMRLRTQRNKPMRSITLGLTGIMRSRKTGLPAILVNETDSQKEYIDLSTHNKRKAADPKDGNSTEKLCIKFLSPSPNQLLTFFPEDRIAHDIKKLCGQNDWIAIVHADGNGLGRVIQKIGNDVEKLRNFSRDLNTATIAAAQIAYRTIRDSNDKVMPIRPVVLGGDDLTIICRADIAIPFTKIFIESFQLQTKKLLGKTLRTDHVFNGNKDMMTVCAGISFIKSSYPFYYGYQLAETLCNKAKEDAKKKARHESQTGQEDGSLAKSCIMFHKVQSSYIESYDEIIRKELKAFDNALPKNDISFKYGPYYLKWDQSDTQSWSHRWTIEQLVNAMSILNGEGNPIKSHLREWLNLLTTNKGLADQKIEKLKKEIARNPDRTVCDIVDKITTLTNNSTPAYDILSLHSIVNQKTK